MKVKELITELSKMDQTLEVCIYTEDAFAATYNNGVRAFDIVSIAPIAANRIRDKNHLPSLDLLDAQDPRKIALIEITSGI